MDAELGGVEIKDGIAVAQFLAKGVVAAYGVDFLAGVLGNVRHLMEHLPSPQRQIAAGDIQTGHQQVAAGGGLGQVDDLTHIALVHVGANEQQAGLGQAAAAFVHGHRGHVGSGCHGGHRQAAAKVEVGSVGFIRKAEHAGVVRHFYDGTQVRADAVVGGVIHQHSHSVGVLLDGLCHLLPLHAQRDAQALIHLRVHIHRHSAAQHQRVQHAAVHVAGQNDLIAPLAGGKHHALHAAGGAAYH